MQSRNTDTVSFVEVPVDKVVREEGSTMLVNPVPQKAQSLIVSNLLPSSNFTSVKAVQLTKALFPIENKRAGSVILLSEVQLEKAPVAAVTFVDEEIFPPSHC